MRIRGLNRNFRRSGSTQPTMLQQALSAIRRNGGTLLLPGASTPVLGEELVTNGGFDSDTDWTKGAGWTIADGVAAHAAGPASYLTHSPALSLAGGKSFSVTYSVTITAGGGVRVEAAGSALGIFRTTSGTYTETIAPTSSGSFRLYAAVDSVCTFDNISVKEILSYTHGNPALRNYLDSAGTDLLDSVTQVDLPVGLVLDSMGVLGAELATQSSWAASGIGGPAFTVQNVTPAKPIGKTYVLSATVSGYSGSGTVGFSGVDFGGSAAGSISGNGSIYAILQATATDPTALYTRSTNTAIFSNVSVREIPGNHASQPTPSSKPILRRTSGRYSWEFGGSNDFLQTGITTGNEGWVCAGVNFTDSNSTIVVSGAGSNAQKGIWAYRTASNDMANLLIGNGTLVTSANARLMPANTPCVWEGWWTATAVGQAVDGVGGVDVVRAGDATPPPNPLRIGAYTDGTTYAANGPMSAIIYTPVLPSAADRALIRRFIGSLQGQTL